MRSGVAVALALAATAAGAPAAAAGTSTEVTYRLTGELSARWSGPSGERGTLSLPLRESGDFSFDSDGSGGSGSSFELGLSESAAIVRVERDLPGGGVARCTDALATGSTGLNFDALGPRFVTFGIADPGPETQAGPLSSGRCAGPVAADLANLMPAGRLDLRRARRRAVRVRLRDVKPFQAGGVRGELTADVAVRFGRAKVVQTGRPVRAGRSQAGDSYTVAGIDGSLAAGFAGGTEPACRLLDACGLAGSSTVTLRAAGDTVDVPTGGALYGLDATATTSGRSTRPDGPSCADTVEQPVGLNLRARELRGGAVRVALETGRGADLFRTRCAGPGEAEIGHVLATGEIPAAEAGRDEIGVRLRAGGGPVGAPFTGSRSGELVLRLERG